MPHPQPRWCWYLVQFKPNCAQIAQRNLVRQGFETFLPLERTTQRSGGRFVQKTRPYFGSYLFVSLEAGSAPWSKINSTIGVIRLVSFGQIPRPVPAKIMQALLGQTSPDGIVQYSPDLRNGDSVRISNGPFSGFLGHVDALASDQRAWVLLDIMGKETRVSIKRDNAKIVEDGV